MINTTLCYIKKDGKYLLIHRNKKENDLNAQKWIGVGGKFEPGESVQECLVREVKEETGLTLTEYEHVGMIKFISDKYEDEDMYLFLGTSFTGTVNEECDEGTLAWVDESQLLSLPTWEGDKYFLKPMISGQRNLNMTVVYQGDELVKVENNTAPVETDESLFIKSPHGFSTRIGGISDNEFSYLNLGMNRGDIKERVTENWRRFLEASGISYRPFVCGKQVHENNVHIATSQDARWAYGPGELIEADGYVTNERGLPLAIFTADCVPVLLEDIKSGVVGAVHCGWRSTVSDIEAQAIEKMCRLGASASDIKIAIGPAIDKCCFEVGYEVIEAVEKLIGKTDAASYYTMVLPDSSKKSNFDSLPEKGDAVQKYMLDLRGVVSHRFCQLGILKENIEMVGGCTMCHPQRYYSHRYSKGSRGSLATVIMLE